MQSVGGASGGRCFNIFQSPSSSRCGAGEKSHTATTMVSEGHCIGGRPGPAPPALPLAGTLHVQSHMHSQHLTLSTSASPLSLLRSVVVVVSWGPTLTLKLPRTMVPGHGASHSWQQSLVPGSGKYLAMVPETTKCRLPWVVWPQWPALCRLWDRGCRVFLLPVMTSTSTASSSRPENSSGQ